MCSHYFLVHPIQRIHEITRITHNNKADAEIEDQLTQGKKNCWINE